MKQLARTLVLGAIATVWGTFAALAGSYTVHLASGETLETRYLPRFGVHDVWLLNNTGSWVTLPRESVRQVTNEGPDGAQARMLDANTVVIGWAPNDAPHAPLEEASAISGPLDPVALLLVGLELRRSRPRQDFSVAQFVDTEDMVGGIPAAGLYYFDVVEQDPLRAIQGLPPEGDLIETLLGLPPGGLRRIQGLRPEGNLIEILQGLPPGGLRAIQGLPPESSGLSQVAPGAGARAGGPPGGG